MIWEKVAKKGEFPYRSTLLVYHCWCMMPDNGTANDSCLREICFKLLVIRTYTYIHIYTHTFVYDVTIGSSFLATICEARMMRGQPVPRLDECTMQCNVIGLMATDTCLFTEARESRKRTRIETLESSLLSRSLG